MPRSRRRKSDTSHSKLSDHKRDKKRLIPPFNTLGNVQLQSWIDDRLPDMLWAALLTLLSPRERYLELFRAISSQGLLFKNSAISITHTDLAKIDDRDFDELFDSLIKDDQALALLTPLHLFTSLPDHAKWQQRLSILDKSVAVGMLERAISQCLFHQSEAATDIRWLRVRFMIFQGRMRFPPKLAPIVQEMIDFPKVGDLRMVRPAIRSMEGVIAGMNAENRSSWPDEFWTECLKNTPCASSKKNLPSSEFPHDDVNKAWGNICIDCMRHFMATLSTTKLDARHDGVFGLALYALTLVVSLFRPNSTRPAGRLILRALVEAYITLAYLLRKDDTKLWSAYRTYGNGQAKLAFLKLAEADELPKYIDLNTLEHLSNEDLWQEFLDIDLGHWANKDLRRMSDEAGVKDVYDRYYTWPSTFVHSQWPAVRNTLFEVCLNPLHRLHRIPRPPRLDMEDVAWDGVKIGNLMLELVNKAYPSFKPRFHMPAKKKTAPRKSKSKLKE